MWCKQFKAVDARATHLGPEGWRGECTDPTRADEPTSTSGGASTRGMARPDTSSAHYGNGGRTDHRARSGRRHRQSIPRPPPCLRPDACDARHASSWRLRALQKTFTDGKRRCDSTESAQKRSQSIAGPHGRVRTPGAPPLCVDERPPKLPKYGCATSRAARNNTAAHHSASRRFTYARRESAAWLYVSVLRFIRSSRCRSHQPTMTLRGYGRWHPGTPTLGRAVLCFCACARRRWTLCTRWQRVMWHAGTPCRAASTRVNPVRHLRLLPHRHQGGRRAPWSDAPRRSSSPPWRVERRHAGPCAQLCTRQGSCPPRPSIQIGSRDRSASETTTTGSHSLLDSLECRVLIGAVCVSSHASRGCRVICFDHCCLEVCRLSKFTFFDRYLLQSTRSRVGSRGCTVFRSRGARPPPRAAHSPRRTRRGRPQSRTAHAPAPRGTSHMRDSAPGGIFKFTAHI